MRRPLLSLTLALSLLHPISCAPNATDEFRPPSIFLARPAKGGFVIAGQKTLLDVRIDLGSANSTDGLLVPQDGVLCLAMGDASPAELLAAGTEQCWGDSSLRFLVPGPGAHALRPYLRSAPSAQSPARVLLSGAPLVFSAGPAATCNGTNFGRPPCMITRPTCGRFLKFRFYLYPATSLPSSQAAALYLALAASPMRTEDPFAACVYVGVTDVRASNVAREPLEATAARLARLPLWGSGENHIVFTFGDYGPGFDTGRAMVAASSFSPPLDPAWFAARGSDPAKLPASAAERRGYDVVAPLPFYRCNLPQYAHLQKYGSGPAAAAASVAPGERRYLLTFKGAAYEFPPGHPAEARLALRRLLHNGRDVHVALTCWSLAPGCDPCEPPACASPPLQNHTTARLPECAGWTEEANARCAPR